MNARTGGGSAAASTVTVVVVASVAPSLSVTVSVTVLAPARGVGVSRRSRPCRSCRHRSPRRSPSIVPSVSVDVAASKVTSRWSTVAGEAPPSARRSPACTVDVVLTDVGGAVVVGHGERDRVGAGRARRCAAPSARSVVSRRRSPSCSSTIVPSVSARGRRRRPSTARSVLVVVEAPRSASGSAPAPPPRSGQRPAPH